MPTQKKTNNNSSSDENKFLKKKKVQIRTKLAPSGLKNKYKITTLICSKKYILLLLFHI